MSLAGKVIIVTGGTKGIGAAITTKLVAEGASVVITYGSDSAAADALVKSLGGPKQVLAISADASKLADIEKTVKGAVDAFGKIDIVIANAGTMPMITLEDLTEENLSRVMDLNFKGPVFLAQKAVRHMPRGGKILFVSTSLTKGTNFTPGYLPYMASKGAIEQSVRVLAKALAPKGITVNAFSPGPTATELFLKGKPDAMIDNIKKMSPFNKLGEPDEIGDFVSLLCSDRANWFSGQTVLVNGALC